MIRMNEQSEFVRPASALPAMTGLASQPGNRRLEEGGLRLALVDDDDDFREVVGAELEDHGFAVTSFPDGPPLLDYLADGNEADVIVLDWNLPTWNGIDLLPQLRRRGVNIPVIILTALSGTSFEMAALERGALDFIDKSRGVPVLARRARLIADAAKLPPGAPVEDSVDHGALTLRPRLSRAYWRGVDVELTVTEFNIVQRLVDNAGDHVTYRAIYDCVHRSGFIAGSGEDGYRTNVRSSVKRIRNKFRAIDPGFGEIENFAAFGYCWRNPPTPA
ncbi:response regulator transcription factor [Niveispirillum cyanobacteriorum]|nr:response regulator transcription factor [Niveispirillum cyanobacteriorum]